MGPQEKTKNLRPQITNDNETKPFRALRLRHKTRDLSSQKRNLGMRLRTADAIVPRSLLAMIGGRVAIPIGGRGALNLDCPPMRGGACIPFGDINPVAAILLASPFGRFIMLCCVIRVGGRVV